MAQSSFCSHLVGWISSVDHMGCSGVASAVAMGDSSSHES